MKALEFNAEYCGLSRLQLMENAGNALASEIITRFPSRKTKVVFFCGLGGNGGDGFVAARHLLSSGYSVRVVLGGQAAQITHREAKTNFYTLAFPPHQKLSIAEILDSTEIPLVDGDVVVDALIGVGLKSAVRPPIRQLIREINGLQSFRVSVDIPSGLNADTGEALNEAVRANLTVTFHKAKPGLLINERHVGELTIKPIGLPWTLEQLAGPGDVFLVENPRPPESHKGDFGRLLIVGGSEIYAGAPILAASAALRAGVDLTYVAAPEKTAHVISSLNPNVITIKLKGANLAPKGLEKITEYLHSATAVLLGPGLGIEDETKAAVNQIIASVEKLGTPMLLDADGIKAFADVPRRLDVPSVVTPHGGEYQILTGKTLPSALDEKVERVKKAASRFNTVMLLKGNVDVISDGTRVKQNYSGNPGMTVGGTGDILSGVIGGFLAQGIDPFDAAVAGAFINGAAGDFVEHEKGHHLVATDLLEQIPRVIQDPMSHLKVKRRER
ncbi:MAG: NAD(P)H-hydrate dehydratase [Candidatus Bathyarchaeota archaeon]|nr:MAG: NAD(P)H-hydrate dehydratase [Candidatus Bathyarchaeota archaeon]